MSSDINKTHVKEDDFGSRVAGAAKWSVLTQVASKLISPVTTMVLARLLSPAAFGVVASATMVTSLADTISDSGFQRYLVQHRFSDDDELSLSACVAFWTNLAVSVAIAFFVILSRQWLATLVGSDGWGDLLAVASLSLPLTSLSSVQTALYQRRFDFRTLFGSRVGSSLLILAVSVPLAAFGLGPWSMVVGTLSSNLFLAFWLTANSPWKPTLRYSFRVLRHMLSYGLWILGEAAATWVNMWAGTFIIGRLMDQTHVGFYKTSTSMSNSIITLVTSAVLPVVFVALSEVQNDPSRFRHVFLRMQGYLALGVVPLTFGVLVYHDLTTLLLLGSQWSETALFFGLWTAASALVVVIGFMCSEAYRALGRPELCAFVQVAFLVPFLPVMWWSASVGYDAVTWAMPATKLCLVVIQMPILWKVARIGPLRMLGNMRWVFVASAAAMIPGVVITSVSGSPAVAAASAVCSAAIYLGFVVVQPDMRQNATALLKRLGLKPSFLGSGFGR